MEASRSLVVHLLDLCLVLESVCRLFGRVVRRGMRGCMYLFRPVVVGADDACSVGAEGEDHLLCLFAGVEGRQSEVDSLRRYLVDLQL